MRFIMFQPRFESAIKSCLKDQTIRPVSKRPYKVGEVVSLRVWTGRPYITPQREFAQAEIDFIHPVRIESASDFFVCGERLPYAEIQAMAVRDGFSSVDDMMQFFNKLPFNGTLYRWRLIG